MYTKGFLNYLSVIVVFLTFVFKDEIVKFQRILAVFLLRKVEG